jgi:hypothetical protein
MIRPRRENLPTGSRERNEKKSVKISNDNNRLGIEIETKSQRR